MQINGPSSHSINSVSQNQPVRGPVKPAHFHTLAASRVAETNDELTLSSEAIQRLEGARAASTENRSSRIAQIRAEIAEGRYDTPDKLELAVDRLLERIG